MIRRNFLSFLEYCKLYNLDKKCYTIYNLNKKVQKGVFMFGYVKINKMDLTFREYDYYKAYYCGLCKYLKEIMEKSLGFL